MKKLLVILFVICLFACDARDDRHIVEDGISKIMLVSDLHYLSSDLYDNGLSYVVRNRGGYYSKILVK